jgi:hypothetical protein
MRPSARRVGDEGAQRLAALAPSLRDLDLSYSAITNAAPAALRPLTRLTRLSVDSRLISDAGLRHLTPLLALRALDVFGCKVLCLPRCLSLYMRYLTSITRCCAQCCGRVLLSTSGALRMVVHARVSGRCCCCCCVTRRVLTPADAGRKTGSRPTLAGACVQLGTVGCFAIAKLTALEWLEAAGGVLTDSGVVLLAAPLSHLTYLSIAQNVGVTDASWRPLSRLAALRSLNVSGTGMSVPRAAALASLGSLTQLSVYGLPHAGMCSERLMQDAPRVHVVWQRGGGGERRGDAPIGDAPMVRAVTAPRGLSGRLFGRSWRGRDS